MNDELLRLLTNNQSTEFRSQPKNATVKRHFGHFFPQQLFFRGLGLVRKETDHTKTNPAELLAKPQLMMNPYDSRVAL